MLQLYGTFVIISLHYCRAHVGSGDFAVDLGCSFGEGTKLMAPAGCDATVLGLDLVQAVVPN